MFRETPDEEMPAAKLGLQAGTAGTVRGIRQHSRTDVR
jgi:hypothetical protein